MHREKDQGWCTIQVNRDNVQGNVIKNNLFKG
jgi:hypothetical protein